MIPRTPAIAISPHSEIVGIGILIAGCTHCPVASLQIRSGKKEPAVHLMPSSTSAHPSPFNWQHPVCEYPFSGKAIKKKPIIRKVARNNENLLLVAMIPPHIFLMYKLNIAIVSQVRDLNQGVFVMSKHIWHFLLVLRDDSNNAEKHTMKSVLDGCSP
jgi:hypothetical protein